MDFHFFSFQKSKSETTPTQNPRGNGFPQHRKKPVLFFFLSFFIAESSYETARKNGRQHNFHGNNVRTSKSHCPITKWCYSFLKDKLGMQRNRFFIMQSKTISYGLGGGRLRRFVRSTSPWSGLSAERDLFLSFSNIPFQCTA